MGLSVATLLVLLVGAAHIFFGYKEITNWPGFAGRVLGKQPDDPEIIHTVKLAKNQGTYNLFLGVGLLLAAMTPLFGSASHTVALYLLACVVVAGVVGWQTLGAKALLTKQAGMGAIAIVACLVGW